VSHSMAKLQLVGVPHEEAKSVMKGVIGFGKMASGIMAVVFLHGLIFQDWKNYPGRTICGAGWFLSHKVCSKDVSSR